MPIIYDFCPYQLGIAKTDLEKVMVYELRERNYKNYADYLLNKNASYAGKDQSDEDAYLFYLSWQNKIISALRLVRVNSETSEIDGLLPRGFNVFQKNITLELSRVVVDREFRNEKIHELIFYYAAQWIMQCTCYKKYIAICKKPLLRIYQRLGAEQVFDKGFVIPNRNQYQYFYIGGSFTRSAMLLEGYLSKRQQVINI